MLDSYPLRRPVDFVKLDIEGAEPLALRGSRNLLTDDRPVIMSELHPVQLGRVAGYSPDGWIAEMRAYGYGCYILGEGWIAGQIDTYQKDDLATVVFAPPGRLERVR
jgi:hypothetical protein